VSTHHQKTVHPPAAEAESSTPRSLPRRILIAEDNELARNQLQKALAVNPELEVQTTSDGSKALQLLAEENFSLLITDLRMPKLDGMQLIQEIQKRRLPVTVIVTTGHGSIEGAVQAVRLGAYDFLAKPIDVDNLRVLIERALHERTLQDEVTTLRRQLQDRYSFHNILSKSPAMLAVFELINNLAHSNTTVLIEGETGTGKEMVARAIHESSFTRRAGPMVALNCAAVPETLLESELFGHEKGAFTSAVSQRQGRFELAHGGTLFLDEVGDVPASMQAKLLRVLQERRFERVGGTQSIEVDVRVITATNRPLQRLTRKGKFRQDLYYRLNVVKIMLPPLRERAEDIPLLAAHFAHKYTPEGQKTRQVSPEVMEVLLNYRWPGNVRELENAIERACVTSRDEIIHAENLPPDLVAPPASTVGGVPVDLNRPLLELLRESSTRLEHQYIRKALKKARGSVSRCAKICGLSRRSMTTKISEYKLNKDEYKNL
jgi:two-component system, NtrC family, response regulator AtoC